LAWQYGCCNPPAKKMSKSEFFTPDLDMLRQSPPTREGLLRAVKYGLIRIEGALPGLLPYGTMTTKQMIWRDRSFTWAARLWPCPPCLRSTQATPGDPEKPYDFKEFEPPRWNRSVPVQRPVVTFIWPDESASDCNQVERLSSCSVNAPASAMWCLSSKAEIRQPGYGGSFTPACA